MQRIQPIPQQVQEKAKLHRIPTAISAYKSPYFEKFGICENDIKSIVPTLTIEDLLFLSQLPPELANFEMDKLAILYALKNMGGEYAINALKELGWGDDAAYLTELSYRTAKYGYTLADLEYERQRQTISQQTLMIAILGGTIASGLLYGPSFNPNGAFSNDSALDMLEKNGYLTREQKLELYSRLDESAGKNWGNQNTLQDHFNRHGADFGATSPQDYANKANDFYVNRSNYQVKVDQNGITRVYDPSTNTFGSYNASGTTKTFYKPTDGQTYFDRQ